MTGVQLFLIDGIWLWFVLGWTVMGRALLHSDEESRSLLDDAQFGTLLLLSAVVLLVVVHVAVFTD